MTRGKKGIFSFICTVLLTMTVFTKHVYINVMFCFFSSKIWCTHTNLSPELFKNLLKLQFVIFQCIS